MQRSLAPRPRLPWLLVTPLSIGQILSWGSLIYAFTLFLAPMEVEFGWSKSDLSLAYSLGMLASACGAIAVGRAIDLGHGRAVMSAGSALAAALFVLWSRVESYAVFVLIWVGLGLAMSATLYEPAFAVLTRALGPHSRRGISAMSLWGGFASTLVLPLTQVMIERWGWRDALLGLASLNLLCAFIHLAVVPRSAAVPTGANDNPSRASRVLAEPAFWGLVVVAFLHSALLSGTLVHLIPLLVARGFALDGAIAAFALFGPAQVAARIALIVAGERLGMRMIGLVTLAAMTAAFALLPLIAAGSGLIALFAILFGAANGSMTILRALMPQELFGRGDYGAIQGLIAAPATIARAAGPIGLALLWSSAGATGPVLAACAITAITATLVFAITVKP